MAENPSPLKKKKCLSQPALLKLNKISTLFMWPFKKYTKKNKPKCQKLEYHQPWLLTPLPSQNTGLLLLHRRKVRLDLAPIRPPVVIKKSYK